MPEDSRQHLEFHQTTFDDFDFGAEVYDVINAQSSLAFHSPGSFVVMFERLKVSLKQGGIFVGNFFGDRDEWNKPTDGRVFLSMEEVQALFVGMDILEFNEIDDPEGITANGDKKHWHRFDVIARKPLPE